MQYMEVPLFLCKHTALLKYTTEINVTLYTPMEVLFYLMQFVQNNIRHS